MHNIGRLSNSSLCRLREGQC